jgi:hypothetical protein
LVPFAQALQVSGHEVRVAAPASFGEAVGFADLHLEPFDDASLDSLGGVFARLPGLSMLEANRVVVRDLFAGLDARAALPGLRALVDRWSPEVVLREPGEFASYVVAEEHGIPHVQVSAGLDRLFDTFFEAVEGAWDQLGAPNGPAGLSTAPRWTLLPGSFDSPSQVASGGPQRFRQGAESAKTPALPDWWGASGLPLIYVTFGSVAASIGVFPQMYAATLEALADTPARVLITLGRGADPEDLGPLPGNTHAEQWWPQEEVMPHAALVVSHGGAGTTLAALAAGVPQVIVPLFAFDQFATALRVSEVGVGAAVPGRSDLLETAPSMTVGSPALFEELRQTVTIALNDEALRQRAAAVAVEVAALPECGTCVGELEVFARRPER